MKKKIIQVLIILICVGFCYNISYAIQQENDEQGGTAQEKIQQSEEEKTPTSVQKNETMYVQERCNIRASYSVDSDRVGGLDAGTEVKVIEEYSNGWYKIEYEGGNAYIKSGILRSTPPAIEENKSQEQEENVTSEEPKQETISEEDMSENETIQTEETSVQDVEKMDEEYTKIINDIGVLPEVGKNLADYLYIICVFLAIGMIIYIKLNN